MIYVAVAQLLVIVVLVAIVYVRERQHDAAIKWMVETEQVERDKLLQRIQHPDREPVTRGAAAALSTGDIERGIERDKRRHEISEEHKANLAAIGTVAVTD